MTRSLVPRSQRKDCFAGRGILRGRLLDDHAQDFTVALRRNRQPVFEIPCRKTAFSGIVAQFDIAVFQGLAVGRADDRQQHAAAGAIWQLLPVDVEGGGVRRGRPPFQHVEPPGIIRKMHADMVRHEIQNQPEIVLPQRGAQPLKAGFATEFRIELGMVDDVVPMRAALAGVHEGRGIEMADAERLEIRHHGSRGVEIEIRRQLQAVGRDRDRRGHFPIRCARARSRAEHCRPTRCPRSGFPRLCRPHGGSLAPTGWPAGGA